MRYSTTATDSRPQLSLVIPCCNEERRIPRTLALVVAHLVSRYPFEVLVVDDGSRDGTAAAVEAVAARHPEVRLLRMARHRGKGAAVREGMRQASGDVAIFSDADLSVPIEELEKLTIPLEGGVDVVIGSRALPTSEIAIHQNAVRERMGQAFNVVMRRSLPLPFRDTQCGFKGFRRAAAREIFSRTRIDGFAFDVEVLMLAARLGYRVTEVPVRWEDSRPSKVNMVVHPLQMCRDLWRIHRNLRCGVYHLASPAARPHEAVVK